MISSLAPKQIQRRKSNIDNMVLLNCKLFLPLLLRTIPLLFSLSIKANFFLLRRCSGTQRNFKSLEGKITLRNRFFWELGSSQIRSFLCSDGRGFLVFIYNPSDMAHIFIDLLIFINTCLLLFILLKYTVFLPKTGVWRSKQWIMTLKAII